MSRTKLCHLKSSSSKTAFFAPLARDEEKGNCSERVQKFKKEH